MIAGQTKIGIVIVEGVARHLELRPLGQRLLQRRCRIDVSRLAFRLWLFGQVQVERPEINS